jgi:hypothetical protein
MSDYSFSFSITGGHHVIAVENAGARPHMLVIHREAPGAGVKEFLAWGEILRAGRNPATHGAASR